MTGMNKSKLRWPMLRWPMALCGALLLALGVGGCSRFGDICQAATDCANGNDRDLDACIVDAEAAADRADLFGCTEWFNEYRDCIESRSRCQNNVYGLAVDDCQNEHERYSSCMSE